MNVLVCVKQIPDPNAPGKLDPQTKRLVREGVDLVLDPGDEHGVEAGLQLIEKDAGEVTVISMGPPKAVDAMRRAPIEAFSSPIRRWKTPMPSAPRAPLRPPSRGRPTT